MHPTVKIDHQNTNCIMTQNISEYIIEMYRKEDMLRAYHLDLEKFGRQVINFFPISNQEKLAQVNYYEEMVTKMKDQGIEETGHLAELNELVQSLEQLHQQLKDSDDQYLAVYNRAKEDIITNLEIAKGKITQEVQVCLNGIYGLLLLKIDGREIKDEEQKMVQSFGDLLSLLSYKYEEQRQSN